LGSSASIRPASSIIVDSLRAIWDSLALLFSPTSIRSRVRFVFKCTKLHSILDYRKIGLPGKMECPRGDRCSWSHVRERTTWSFEDSIHSSVRQRTRRRGRTWIPRKLAYCRTGSCSGDSSFSLSRRCTFCKTPACFSVNGSRVTPLRVTPKETVSLISDQRSSQNRDRSGIARAASAKLIIQRLIDAWIRIDHERRRRAGDPRRWFQQVACRNCRAPLKDGFSRIAANEILRLHYAA